ncbi:Optc [Phodopus roborovskii]|uniref:Optc protein n=1 Tax=Phodopus roborovskii TaxID=109678 RepID=A0AAV0A3J1_PHORO|nr:Optc [Phodopus roborovskii]
MENLFRHMAPWANYFSSSWPVDEGLPSGPLSRQAAALSITAFISLEADVHSWDWAIPSPIPPQNPMRLLAFLSLLALVLHEAGTAWLPGEMKGEEWSPEEGDAHAFLHVGNYDLDLEDYGEVIDLSSYEGPADYGDQILEVREDSLTLPTRASPSQSTVAPKTSSSSSSNLTMTGPTTSGLPNSQSRHGLPTCLVCVCLGCSVYCDDADLENVPPLPQMTTYLYAHFNHISHIQAGDFKGLTKLKRIDLSSNSISSIHNDTFRLLPALQHLILTDNQLATLPVLPSGIEFLDVRLNRLQSSGIQPEAFVALEKLQFLYLADNLLDSIPGPLPLSLRSLHLQNNMIHTMERDTFCDTREHRQEHRRQLEDIRLDGNPINLSLFPEAYFCLPRLPVGRFT